jgi:methyl-accepting chemotaxis protein
MRKWITLLRQMQRWRIRSLQRSAKQERREEMIMFLKQSGRKSDASLLIKAVASHVDEIGIGICEIDGNVERVNDATGRMAAACQDLDRFSSRLSDHNFELARSATLAQETGYAATERIHQSSHDLSSSLDEMRSLVRGTEDIGVRMNALHDALRQVADAAEMITTVSRQTNLLSINAAIEAAKAGDAGRSFAVVASAVKQLAIQSNDAAQQIGKTTKQLSIETMALMDLSAENLIRASRVDETTVRIGATMAATASAISDLHAQAKSTATTSNIVVQDCRTVCELVQSVADSAAICHQQVTDTHERLERLLLVSDELLNEVAVVSGDTTDSLFIKTTVRIAHEVSMAFEKALNAGRITAENLFSNNYILVPGSNPSQFVAGFTDLCDDILPPIQDPVLALDSRIKICGAFDRNGYLPTNHPNYCHPQTHDVAWNEANCRNRRIFEDRTTVAAVAHPGPFLVQTYRRQMGNGTNVVMKEASAPIKVNGLHWGAVRLAYLP